MEKKKLCIKMFIIFASFFVLFILRNSNVFASSNKSVDFTYDNNNYTVAIPSGLQDYKYHFCLLQDWGTSYDLYMFGADSPFIFTQASHPTLDYSEYVYIATKDKSSFKDYRTKFSKKTIKECVNSFIDNSFEQYIDMTFVDGNGVPSQGLFIQYNSGSYKIIYSNEDIIYNNPENNEEKTLFQKAKEPTQLTIIAKSMDFLAVIREILGILPMILVVLIGLLALMKAIKEIFRMLQKA